MTNRLPLRFWIETAIGVLSAAMFAMALAIPNWIERIFGLAPDSGDGSTEWGWVISLAIATLVLFTDARRLRLRSTQTSTSTK